MTFAGGTVFRDQGVSLADPVLISVITWPRAKFGRLGSLFRAGRPTLQFLGRTPDATVFGRDDTVRGSGLLPVPISSNTHARALRRDLSRR